MHFIKILPGDKVTVELSPYDLTRGGSSTGTSSDARRGRERERRRHEGSHVGEEDL